MVQFNSRADAIADPVAARRKIMMKLRSLAVISMTQKAWLFRY